MEICGHVQLDIGQLEQFLSKVAGEHGVTVVDDGRWCRWHVTHERTKS
jgi:hypothetical protein